VKQIINKERIVGGEGGGGGEMNCIWKNYGENLAGWMAGSLSY